MRHDSSPDEIANVRAAGVAAGLGCSIVVTIIGSIVGGIFLDRWLDTSPWLTLGGVALGLIASGYQLYELATLGAEGSSPKVVTRQISKVTSLRSGSSPGVAESDESHQE